MVTDATHPTDGVDGQNAPVERVVGPGDVAHRGPFTLASLLELNDEELAQPLSRVAPPGHRWEQLSIGVTPETGEAIAAALISGAASQPPMNERELIPGLDVPGAIEVPVYLAGRALSDLMRTSTAPINPPAIKVTAVGAPRKKQPAPAANFAKSTESPVLWPKRTSDASPNVLPQECAKCGQPSHGESCTRCGHETAVPAPLQHPWSHFIAAFLDSDSRVLRTIGALVLAPGELTRAYLAGQRRRYVGPIAVATAALLLFAIASAIGGLRPRPDRTLMIGADRTEEVMPGLANPAVANLAVDRPPDLVRDIATTIDSVPLLWFPLMGFGLIAIVAALRAFQWSVDHADVVYTAHFASWFVIWWGLAVPLLLLVMKFAFEYSAAWDGVGRVRYIEGGQIDGLSPTWNALHATVVTPAFHTWLVGLGLAPWAVIAWRRAFETSWLRAGIAGLVVTAVPLLLLVPFA